MTQIPFLYQKDLAEALGISGDRIRVIQPPVGGNFGRGLDLYPIDIITALLARHVGRPVKIVFDREEEFVASPTREPCVFTLRTAAPADGTLLRPRRPGPDRQRRLRVLGIDDPYVMMTTLAGFYRCPSIRWTPAIVYTNNVYSGSMRGYGNLESTFAVEAQMDDLAERLGLDRLEIRRRNADQCLNRAECPPSTRMRYGAEGVRKGRFANRRPFVSTCSAVLGRQSLAFLTMRKKSSPSSVGSPPDIPSSPHAGSINSKARASRRDTNRPPAVEAEHQHKLLHRSVASRVLCGDAFRNSTLILPSGAPRPRLRQSNTQDLEAVSTEAATRPVSE